MRIGVVLPHTGPTASPTFIRDFAQTAEGCGLDRLWAVDHLVLPHHVSSPYVLGRRPTAVADGWLSENLAPNFEMLTTLSFVAGQTDTIGLGTSVAVLPIRNPIANARQLATLDALSGGRLVYGVGIGWMREEALAMDMPWDNRAARAEEHIDVLRTLWCANEPYVEFSGSYYAFDSMDPSPQPQQRPIPILVGGHSTAAMKRAVRIGDGWISAPTSQSRFAELLAELLRLAEAQGRPRTDLQVVASVRLDPQAGVDELGKTFDAYRRMGVDHLQVVPPAEDPARTIDDLALLAAGTG
ncbi:MAG TPA: TIGR03619 family F420-dependent LLM class oxidoreductase [Mycobacterium sp.]|nr:TIGR03619 family F420-dependent LLM class oxidoreductase [Mycobacterium sp.]